MAIVSNADGTVEASLKRQGLCQVGEGPLTSVEAIVDSAVVGWSKPDARIFGPALDALGVKAEESVYLGDSEKIDVRAALNAGVAPLHFDPYSLCRNPTAHRHIASLSDVGLFVR